MDLNTAPKSELVKIFGVGDAVAGHIIAHREENGGFATLYDAVEVPWVTTSSLDQAIARARYRRAASCMAVWKPAPPRFGS